MAINKVWKKTNVSIFVLFIISSMMLLKFKIFSLFWIMQVLMIAGQVCWTGKIKLTEDLWIRLIFGELLLGVILCWTSSMWLSYKKAAIVSLVLIFPLFFTYSFLEKYVKRRAYVFNIIRDGIRITCLIELIWCLAQFILYKFLAFDLNNFVFVKTLHLVESASHYKIGGVFLPSGLCWHAAFMAPVVVIAFVFFDSYWIKLLAILDAIICNNVTALLGVTVCLLLSLFFWIVAALKGRKVKLKKYGILSLAFILVIAITILLQSDILELIIVKVTYLYQKVVGTAYDSGSTEAHILYYTSYPKVLLSSSVVQILFGYGSGCSGYPISNLFGQYASLKSWTTESDFMNILLSRGVFGFILYYGFLLQIVLKGIKIDKRYVILVLSLIISGITYNIQFDWVLVIEMMLWLSLKCNVNIFRPYLKGEK